MTEIALNPEAPRLLTLSDNRNLRIAMLFVLYIAQGLPFGLFQVALPAWLAQNGASAAAVGGVLAMTMLPWSLKLIHGFVMDRYSFLAMGRRRPWIVVSQFGIVAGLLAMAVVNPAVGQVGLIAAFAFAINLASSMQDVAVDGLAVDILPAGEIARANGFMFGGQAIGAAVGAAVSGYLIAYHSLPAALLALGSITATILFLAIIVRERPGERLLPWTKGEALKRNLDLQLGALGPIIRNVFSAMTRRQTLVLIPALFLAGALVGIFTGLAPIYSVRMLGWENDIYSGWSSQANLVGGLAGALMFGFIAERSGPRRVLVLTLIGYALAAMAMLALQGYWASSIALIAAIFIFKGLNVMRSVTAGSVAMTLCTPAVAATQFSLFMAIQNLGNSAGSASLGMLDSLGGIPAMFTAMAVLSLLAAAFAFAAKVGR